MGNGSEHDLVHLAAIGATAGMSDRVRELADRTRGHARPRCLAGPAAGTPATTSPVSARWTATSMRRGPCCARPCPANRSSIALAPTMTTSSRSATRSRHSEPAADRCDASRSASTSTNARSSTRSRSSRRGARLGRAHALDRGRHDRGDERRGVLVLLANLDRNRLTLAATNGLDRSQVGKVSLAWGQGITGRVAATRTPIAVEDVTRDDRFSWVRGFDIEGLRRHAVGAAGLARRRRRRAQRPESRTAPVRRRRDRVPWHDRRAAGGHRREGPPDSRGRGTTRRVDRPRRRAGRAPERRDPRAPDAAVDRSRVCRPAGRGRRPGPTRRGRPRRLALGGPRAARPARSSRRFDPGVRPRRGADRAVAGAVRRRHGGRRDGRDAAPPPPTASRSAGNGRGRCSPSATRPASGRSSNSSSRTNRSTRRRPRA